jgi:Flp pilus assembly protein TadD
MPISSEVLARARSLHQAGHSRQAELLYHQILQTDGANADIWHLHGLACQDQGKLADAAASFQQATRLNGQAADSYFCLASVLMDQGKRDEALANYRHTLHCKPNHVEALIALGVILAEQGQVDEAVKHFRQAIHYRPDHPKAHHNLGIALAQQGKPEEAVVSLREALRLKPDYAEAFGNLANILKIMGKDEESAENYRKALDLKPDYADAYLNLGLALSQGREVEEAVVLLQQAVRLRPKSHLAHNDLGLALAELGRFAEAEESYQQALRLDPLYGEAHNNLGNLYKAQGRMGEAVASYGMALRMKPDAPSTHWNRSLAWLLMGDFARGWPEYEWRWKRPQTPPRLFRQPLWDGSSFEGRTLFIYLEQGLGDIFQFVRFIEPAKARGGRVILECPQVMQPLFATCRGIDELLLEGGQSIDFDLQAPLMTLPLLLGTTLETIPAVVPYLTADRERVRAWAQELAGIDKLKVGIVWQGNPKHVGDRHRSIPLKTFGTLARVDGVQLVSLQKGTGTEQLAAIAKSFPVIDLRSESWQDFMETAAIIANLDLVITVDTAVAHLAGALGKPVWVAVPYSPDWRWLLDREDSPWYPSMRLFRQPTHGDWRTVFDRMAQELQRLVTKNRRKDP